MKKLLLIIAFAASFASTAFATDYGCVGSHDENGGYHQRCYTDHGSYGN
jgi:hypothetical protein